MADEEKPVEEPVTETTETPEATQEELPLAAAAEETAEAEKPAEADAKPAEPVEPPKEDWKDKELKAKYRRQKELERELADERARRELAEAKAAKFNQIKPEEITVSSDDVERQVQERMAQQRYTEESNKINDTGAKTYGNEWAGAISNLEMIGGFDMPTMNGVLATDDPAKVLFELGKNPDRYYNLMRLPLERRIIEMSKLAMAPAARPISNAPAPITPISGRGAPAKETLSDDLSDDEWFRIDEAQQARRKANDRAKFRSR